MKYLFLDTNFEEFEAVTTIDLLRCANIALTTVSVTGSPYVMGAHQIEVKADCCIADCDFSDAGMLILPGGATHLDKCQQLCDLLLKHNEQGKQIAAICAAPSVLGKLGILEGKQATCYPGFEDFLGESFVGGLVVESKNIITAKGPGLASDFAFCLIEHLAGEETADQVYDTAQY
jgi:4-methyl-5(b-hydroxyethyl)-thiazole monophosphate biosynthesis